MSKKLFLFGTIASVIAINSVFADTIVTSQSYVDNRDALKQDKITAGTTGNVVTYNGTQNGQAQFSERAIFDPDTNFDYENNEVATGHEGDLVTAESIFPAMGSLYQQIEQVTNDLPTTTTTKKVCTEWVSGQSHTDENCLLWNLTDQTVYGAQCYTANDCEYPNNCSCVNNRCQCNFS